MTIWRIHMLVSVDFPFWRKSSCIIFYFFKAIFQGISVLLSLCSLSTSLVSYIQASRWADVTRPQMTPLGYFMNFLWRFFIVFSRVFMLSLFATEYPKELFIVLGSHWMLMTLWIFLMVFYVFHMYIQSSNHRRNRIISNQLGYKLLRICRKSETSSSWILVQHCHWFCVHFRLHQLERRPYSIEELSLLFRTNWRSMYFNGVLV